MQNYSVIHVTLLTYIRSVWLVSQPELLENLDKIIQALNLERDEDTTTVEALDLFVSTINNKITETGFRISKYRNQVTGEIYYIFVNTLSDVITKSNTNYTPAEIDAIKRIIDDMMDQSDLLFSLGYVNLSQRISQTLNKTARESNAILNRLVDDGWFELTEEDRLVLSMRSICELKNYLIERNGLFKEKLDGQPGKLLVCHQCSELVTFGFKCRESDCPITFHSKCLDFSLDSCSIGLLTATMASLTVQTFQIVNILGIIKKEFLLELVYFQNL